MTMEQLHLQNGRIRAMFSAANGALLQIEDRARGFLHLQGKAEGIPFRVERGGRMLRAFRAFSYEEKPDGLIFHWDLGGASLKAQVTLLTDGLSFVCSLSGPRSSLSRAVEYPLIQDLVSRGEDSFLAHAYATGVLFQNPAACLPSRGGLRFCPYPESFSGASMQLMTYYHQDQAGLYLAAHDGAGHQKWLNAYASKGSLSLSHMVGFEEVGGAEIRQPYPFVIRLLKGAGWEEAAEHYRAFALKQPWCARGPHWQRREQQPWLWSEVGYTTFGINAGHDRSPWLARYRGDINSRGFHVLGPDWTNRPQTFGSGIPGGLADWLPTRFHPATLAAIRENGDYFAPFEFDFLVALNQSDQQRLKDNLQAFPQPTFSQDGYRFNMLCPCQPFTQAFHEERDARVQQESGCDAMYYDISANNLIKICLREDHDHPPGGGRALTEGYKACYRQTRDRLSSQTGRDIPLGTEMMCEVFLGELDFYQARAWAQPSSTLETWPFRKLMWSGQARMIPMFDYVYHDYGPVRMDGWGKLVAETGDLFYHILAKVYLWGGLYEINHEYSPMEALDGVENKGEEHYFHFASRGFAYAGDRARYLGLYAAARTGAARDYWVYGRLLKAPPISLPQKEYSWFHYNHDSNSATYEARGRYRAEAVLMSLFEHPEGGCALFLANADSQPHTITLSADHLPGLLPGAVAQLFRFQPDGSARFTKDLRMQRGEREAIVLQPLALYMLKIKKKERGTIL